MDEGDHKFRFDTMVHWMDPSIDRHNEWAKYIMSSICLLSLLLSLSLLKRAGQKIRKLREPTPGINYRETYCIISMNLLKITQISLIISCIGLSANLILYLLTPSQFQTIYLKDINRWKTCDFLNEDTITTIFSGWAILLETINFFSFLCMETIQITQGFEWFVMLNIIRNEFNKSVEEIYYSHHAENIDATLIESDPSFSD